MQILILISLLLLSLPTWAENTLTKTHPTKTPLKVGAIIGLSGSMAQAGTEMKKGMEIALKDLGEPAPIQVTFTCILVRGYYYL